MRWIAVVALMIAGALWLQSLGAEPEGEVKDDPVVAEMKAQIRQAGLLAIAGRIDTALTLAHIAFREAREEFGASDSTVAFALRVLGICYVCKGDYTQSETFFKEALDIYRNSFGSRDSRVAKCLDNLGVLYTDQGRYVEAESLLKQALEIGESALGSDHLDLANNLGNLAGVYRHQGRYAEAEPLLERALEIRERRLGPDDPRVAITLSNLGIIYRTQGRYAEAEPLLRQALEIKEKALDPDHLSTGKSLITLGNLYYDLGRYSEAEHLLGRAVEINERALGRDHPDLGRILIYWGRAYKEQGKYGEAESLLERALQISEKGLGSDHPQVALSLFYLGVLNREQGRCVHAESLFTRSIQISEQVFGSSHPDVALCLNNLGKLLGSGDKYSESLTFYQRAQEARRDFINYCFSYASEIQKLTYVEKYPLIDNSLLSLTLVYNTPRSKKQALEMLFDGKGVVLEAVSKEKEAAYCSYDSATIQKFEELNSVGGKIATMVLEGLGKLQPNEYRDSLRILTEYKGKLEAELSQACSEFAEALALRGIRVEDIAEALPKGSVLWEIVKYEPYDFKKIGSYKEKTGLPRYMAFQLSKEGRVEVVDLGEAALIDSLVAAYQDKMSNAGRRILRGHEASAEEELLETTARLYDLVFAPLETHLGGRERIFVSSDGELNLLPYYILPCPDGKYVIEKYEISYLSSGRDLVKHRQQKRPENDYALLVADPDFDMEIMAQSAPVTELGPPAIIAGPDSHIPVRGPSNRSECLKAPFGRIPSTRKEGRAIIKLLAGKGHLKADCYYGTEAAEEVLKSIVDPPKVLHLATHGYFCPEASFSGGVKVYENPLLYSGLVFAGANRMILKDQEEGMPQPPSEDGILTSLEVSGLNLMGTDLVVLSACRTGVGEVKSGEGVFGLRRSFQHAGARSIVMSMWDIPDRETVELMEGFYREWLSGNSKSQALRKSALKVLADRRRSKGVAHPLFWGGFVLVGNPN